MRIISFGWTAEALLAGAKTVTRRDWEAHHARSFHEGDELQAWNRLPYVKGAKRIGTVRLVNDPYPQPTGMMPEFDFANEGFAWMSMRGMVMPDGSPWAGQTPEEAWETWKRANDVMWVVRFRLIKEPTDAS